jgi:hypothetical protein
MNRSNNYSPPKRRHGVLWDNFNFNNDNTNRHQFLKITLTSFGFEELNMPIINQPINQSWTAGTLESSGPASAV